MNLSPFFINFYGRHANTEKYGAVDQRSTGSLALTLTVKTRLWGINETCLQGLNLSSYKVSELSNGLVLLQHVMNAVGLCKSLRETQALETNDCSIYVTRMAFRKYHGMF